MRIVGGQLSGRKLVAPKSTATRPTTERVREALMSMLAARDAIAGATVLDLYAGSGALGLEALSRGAQHATFVESAREAQRAIDKNRRSLRLDGRTRLICTTVDKALKRLTAAGESYGLVFADPPYDENIEAMLGQIGETGLLSTDGILLFEHRSRDALGCPDALKLLTSRRYGDSAVTLFTCAANHRNLGHVST